MEIAMNNKLYFLMHKNIKVAVLNIDENGYAKLVRKIFENDEHFPIGARMNNIKFSEWWKNRYIPDNRPGIKKALEKNNYKGVGDALIENLALSLTDCYWIKLIDSDLTWEDVNLFTNDFRDDIGEMQFAHGGDGYETLDLTGISVFYPSASTQGELRKKWVIRDGKRCLIKGNYGDTCQQSVNEVIATRLHERQGRVPFTRYELCEIMTEQGMRTGCICEDFADGETEFIPAYDIVCSAKKDNALSEYEHFVRLCTRGGLEESKVRTFLEYQILTDFVLTNTDRHFNNFGVLRDSASLSLVGIAPVFDTGNSMFWNCTALPLSDPLLSIPVSSFRKKEVDLLRYVTDYALVDIAKLPGESEIGTLLGEANLTDRQMTGILTGYRKKIDLLAKVQA
jgi:hypothetical protein